MESRGLIDVLQDAVPGLALEPVPSVDLHTTFYAPRDAVPVLARTLRDRPDLRFDVLAELTAVDHWPRDPRFEVVYVMISLDHARRIRVKVRLTGDDARVSTVSGVWPAANWLEREVADLFGIEFSGHPDLRRLLMPEDWDGHPLRKDYPVQVNLPLRTSEALQVSEDEFRRNIEKDRRARS